jgi:hypothetical protein
MNWLQRGTRPTAATSEPSADPILELAYDAAIKAVEQQDTTLGNLRDRAAGLLGAVTLVTTFSAGLGLFTDDPTKGTVLPTWSQWALVVLLVGTAGLSISVMWPITVAFGVDARKILERQKLTNDVNAVRRYVVDELVAGHGRNQQAIGKKFRLYRFAVLALMAETAVLLVAIILKGK